MGSRTSTTRMRRSNDARVRSQEGRDGEERVQPLGKVEHSQDHDDKEKREEERRGKRAEGREKREE